MRLEEPFHIQGEQSEHNVRFVIVGQKTAASVRRVPLPAAVCEMVPGTITGPLFSGSAETSGKRIRYFLRALGISWDERRHTGDPKKVIHSLRHRAKDKLRAARCPLDVQYELLGHEHRTVASGYGHGYPVAELKTWIETIGA